MLYKCGVFESSSLSNAIHLKVDLIGLVAFTYLTEMTFALIACFICEEICETFTEYASHLERRHSCMSSFFFSCLAVLSVFYFGECERYIGYIGSFRP